MRIHKINGMRIKKRNVKGGMLSSSEGPSDSQLSNVNTLAKEFGGLMKSSMKSSDKKQKRVVLKL